MMKVISLLILINLSGCGLVQVRSAQEMNEMVERQKASHPRFEQQNSKNWQYGTQTDPMDNGVTYMAVNYSKNKVNLSFPYQGGTQAKIGLVKYEGRRTVSIEITKGQISFNHIALGRLEEMRVKFGANEIKSLKLKPQKIQNMIILSFMIAVTSLET